MMNNIQIIENLKQSYLGLEFDKCPKFSKKENGTIKEFDSQIVNDRNWDKLSDRRLDLIIVADNPGENEHDENIYLSPNGLAGKSGRTFIEQYFILHRKKGQFLILNKTPFWSNKSSTLKDTSCSIVKKSTEITFEAIESFWKVNKCVKILILGFDKGAIMNKYFFEKYGQCKNESFKKSIYFGKHPSYGHLGSQLASALTSEIKTKRKIKSHRVLKQISNLNRKKIQNEYGLIIY